MTTRPWFMLLTLALAATMTLAEDKPAAAAAAAGGRIVFASNRAAALRIHTVNPDGSDRKLLLDNKNTEESDADPAFSADGKLILFVSTRGGKTGVWKMQADGTKPERICDGDQGELSPDGKNVAFRKNDKIFVRDLASGTEKQIVPDDFATCTGPAWSPDGKTIAFACRWDAGNSLWTVDAAGASKPVKVYDKKPACEPHFSPDGKRLAYETETHICTINLDGTGNKLLTFFGGVQRFPRWSPDGTQIVYAQGVSEKGPWELYIIPATGGNPTQLTKEGSDTNPDWK